LLSQTTDVFKSVTAKVLNGLQTRKQMVVEDGISYRAYVLMELALGDANAALVEGFRNQQNMYNRFRASQTYQELEEEVEKYEDFKKQEGMMK
jgi:tryptophan 2,3-dioxygenase